ncbi:E3 ubiquitin-protein ligase RSL1-like isoform X2 [Gastrolobium bilobum]|nr:E3 ubiquitin-protein ligase RSL1-like isoform X2 [Gastrolobium bilobum]
MSVDTVLKIGTGSTKKHRISVPIPSSMEVVDLEAFCFSHQGTKISTAISVDRASSLAAPVIIDLSDTEDDDDVRILNFKPQNTPFGKRRRNAIDINSCAAEKGECSKSAPFVCEICTETKTVKDSFSISGCTHAYCTECVVMYVDSKLQENVINIRCPVSGCRGLLEAEDCREILSPQVFDRWGKALCEALITADEKFYCPYGDCSALLIHDGQDAIKESECPNCHRMLCAMCKAPWHQGIECEEFQKLNKDEREKEDIMLLQLAKEMKWRRCPICRFYVAKSDGCMYMKCRCGNAFCYNCGARSLDHTHYCRSCRR